MKYTNELHKTHKIFGLDMNGFLFLVSMYGVVVMTTMYALIVCVPLFFIFLSKQKKANRGFIRHTLHGLGFDKATGYPSVGVVLFHQ